MTNYALPTTTGIRSVTFRMVSQNFATQSPFTFKQQVINHPGRRWEVDVQLSPMRDVTARLWIAWLAKLDGQLNTFNMGDPKRSAPQGEGGGTPQASVGNQAGSFVAITGATAMQTDWLKAGDYFQLGTGANASLHMVTDDVDTVSGGGALLPIWPPTTSAPAGGSSLILTNPVGTFRLAGNVSTWSVDQASIYGIQFSAVGVV